VVTQGPNRKDPWGAPARSTTSESDPLWYALAALIPDTDRVRIIEESFDTVRETNARFEARWARADRRQHGRGTNHVCLLAAHNVVASRASIADEDRGAAAFNLMRWAEHLLSRKYDHHYTNSAKET
jgi:hypothetical protein